MTETMKVSATIFLIAIAFLGGVIFAIEAEKRSTDPIPMVTITVTPK